MGIGMMAMTGGSLLMQGLSNRAEDKAIGQQIAAQNAMKTQKVRELNYTIQSLDQEQQDQFDQAVTQLQTNSINAIRNQGMVAAALGESGLEGRTMDSVLREVQGQSARQDDSIRGNFQRSHAGIQQRKEVAVMETQSSLDGMPKIQGPSAASRILGMASAGLSGANAGMKGDAFLKTSQGKELVGTITGLFKKGG